MLRTWVVATLVALAGGVLSPLAGAPVPKDAGKSAVYFPTSVGARWVYEDEGGGEEGVEVSAVEKDGDTLVVSRKGVGGNNSRYTKTIVSPEGLRQDRPGGGDGDDVSVWVLKARLKAGESWKVADGGTRAVSGPEEVKVPAGTFQALKVVWQADGRTLTSWYAPGVGEVKRVIKRCGTETVTRSLKSFTAAKNE